MCTLVFIKYLLYSCVVLYVIVITPSVKGDGCNEFVCGSVVSKCLLTQSCTCKLSDCYCCKDCLNCLGELYIECCSCLDMCPQHNDTLSALAPKSQIGDFEGVPELFDTLTAEEDEDQWSTIRFPMRNSLQRHYNMVTGSFGFGDELDADAFAHKQQQPATVNCTVIYLNSCTTNKKCLQYCESMGSNSYRWFHDGCCECVGANCYNYGINESRCTACPDDDEEEDDEDMNGENMDDADYAGENEDDMSWDYGEDEMNYN
ncbi:protein twisted gastrulation [Calliphora vicina]|uniref:protein twisted gastrulation n=1 Tax=Calliphora vicina TaxID=7373 RepID=UPI00325B098A